MRVVCDYGFVSGLPTMYLTHSNVHKPIRTHTHTCTHNLYRTHPYFISIEAYAELIAATGVMNPATTADWVDETIASWRHSVLVGVYDPVGWIFKPGKYVKCVRDAYCLERMHRAFKRGLMQYGMFAATKKVVEEETKEEEEE